MKIDYDVIIIGAGPAGTTCANFLNKNNIKTIILEKRKMPRIKCCAGLISPKALQFIEKNISVLPDDIFISKNMVTAKVSKIGLSFMSIPGAEFYNVDRKKLDHFLLLQSVSLYGDNTLYLNHINNYNYYTVNYLINNKVESISCKYLVGADGGWSKVRKQVDSYYNMNDFCTNNQYVYKEKSNLDKDSYYFIIGKKYSDCLAWFCEKGGLIYIGNSQYVKNKNRNYLELLKKRISETFSINLKKLVRQECSLSDLRFNKSRYFTGMDNLILVGEASGLIYNYGEGITPALISGKTGAEAIIRSTNTGESASSVYNEMISCEIDYSMTSLNIKN